ncbi:MAG: hypothetical protein IJ735_01740, partial [Clostridia bacterium]|nr:hypothetical protein [Clostridia bacterium]
MFFKVYSCGGAKELPFMYFGGEDVCVRQDTDIPTIKAVFFTTNPDITSNFLDNKGVAHSSILLYYEAKFVNGEYTLTRKDYHLTDNNVWVHQKVYMYILASDYTGVGLGSGIKYVSSEINGVDEYFYTRDQDAANKKKVVYNNTNNPYNYLYRSAGASYGYITATEAYGISLSIIDNQNNAYNVDLKTTISKDKDGRKILPIVDSVIPTVRIDSATYSANNINYLGDDKRFNGANVDPIREPVKTSFVYVSGISDSNIYVRRRTFGESLPADSAILTKNSVPGSGVYGFLANSGVDLSEWTFIGGKEAVGSGATGSGGKVWPYTIGNSNTDPSIKNRFDILIVNGAGIYYYMDGGDVFYDSAPPVIDESKTFFSLASDADNDSDVIDYTELSRLTMANFTNDDVYAYFYVTDAASGVEKVTYSSASGTIDLEKVSLKRDGVTYEKGNGKGDGYYRLKMTAMQNYKVTATDLATNKSPDSTELRPSIDKQAIGITVELKRNDGVTYTSGSFTNADSITVKLGVNLGASKFTQLQYAVTDKGGSPETWTTLTTSSGIGTGISIVGVGQQNATITFTISAEQNKDYYVRAYNGVLDQYSVGGARPFGVPERTNPIGIAIDRTPPVVDLNKGNYGTLTTVWHSTPEVLKLSISDPNSYGSGVDKVNVTYTTGTGVNRYNGSFKMNPVGSLYTSGSSVLDHYVVYTVTMTDLAGNSSTQEVLPKIDTYTPTYDMYEDNAIAHTFTRKAPDDIYPDLVEKAYTVGNVNTAVWTNMNVEALFNVRYSISGAKLYYKKSTSGNFSAVAWQEWGTNYLWYRDPVAGEDDGVTGVENDSNMLFSVLKNESLDAQYQIKVVSNAGLESEIYTIGRISIDKVKPEIEGIVRTNGNNTNWGTSNAGEYKTDIEDEKWTQNYIYVNLSTKSTIVSGYSYYYNLSQGDPIWIRVTNGFEDTENFALNYGSKTFLHTISTSVNDEDYEYYIESNSGMRSEVYKVNGVKIDQVAPRFSLMGEKSSVYGTPQGEGKLNVATEEDYTNEGSLNYNLKNPTWVSTNSVIVRVNIDKINTSGLKLYVNNTLYDTFRYADYVGQTEICRYYVVTKTTDLSVALRSGAGKEYASTGTVQIDNVIPMVYVSGITGTKSTNWDDTLENSWYTSATRINFKVGTMVKDGSGEYVFSETKPESSYKIEYTIDDGENWVSIGTSTMLTIIGNPYEQNTYRFRIKNGAYSETNVTDKDGNILQDKNGNPVKVQNNGMITYLGKDVYDNNNQISKTSVAVTKARVTEILTAKGAILQHLAAENSYDYNINVDSNTYYIVDKQILSFINNGQKIDVTTKTDFATYGYELYKDGAYHEVPLTDLAFKRGDLIRISYAANVSDDYIHRYTEYGVYDSTSEDWASREYDGYMLYKDSAVYNVNGMDLERRYTVYEQAADREESGSFTYRFSDSSLTMNAYFIKLLEVSYGNEILYKQTSTEANVQALTTYTYKTASGATTSAGIPLSVAYTTMTGEAVDGSDLPLGGYLVNTTVDGENALSFRLKNPMTVLLVKYFQEKVSGSAEIANSKSNPYSITIADDLAYVSEDYYDSYTKLSPTSFVLGEVKSYLSSAYKLKADVMVPDAIGIEGKFVGYFDGNGYTLTMAQDVAASEYGFFEEFAGEATTMIVELGGTLGVHGASNVGVFAARMTGGQVSDMRVEGDIVVVSAAGGASIGGLVGEMTAGKIGSDSGKVFVDAVVENRGNNITSASIGGVVGTMGADAIMNYVYAYTFVTVYKVGADVKAGAVVGSLETETYGDARYDHFFNNRYLATNTFVNDVAVSGFAGTNNDVNDAGESMNTVKPMLYASFVNSISGEGATTVVGKTVRTLVLDRLYEDFDVEVTAFYSEGTGASLNSPFIINSVEMLRTVGKYMNVYFKLNAD